MESQVVAALSVSDYKQTSQLLKQWHQQDPSNPLLRLYAAQLQEKTNRLEAAEKNYLKLLKSTSHTKLMGQARAGIQRVQQLTKAQQQQEAQQHLLKKATALEQARSGPDSEQPAILAIATPTAAHQKEAIAALAQAFNIEPYSARMKIPNSGFRIARVIPWGEASYYAHSLGQANLPTVCAKINSIKALQTFQIEYFEAIDSEAVVVCKDAAGQLGKINFDWHEVSQSVSGQLPIFEQVVDLGPRGRMVHKEKVLDYAQVMDLHLPSRQIVLRMCDRSYQFNQSTHFTHSKELNSRIQWNQLSGQISHQLSRPTHNEFSRFGKSALEFTNLLPVIHPQLDLKRQAPSDWDIAFHLYSSLHFLKPAQSKEDSAV